MGFCSLPRGIVVGTPLTPYQSSHIVRLGMARGWPFIFPVNGIDPQKSCAYRNSINLRLFRRTQLINEISNGTVRSVSIQRQWFTEALREVFCHFVSALIKEWQPYIHDYILCYLLWLQGQTNKPCTSAITFFIKPPCSYFPNTRPGFLFCIRADWEYLVCVKACLLSQLTEKASQWKYLGYFFFFFFKKLLPCHHIAKCSANSSPP